MVEQLIVDFPTHRNRSRRSVCRCRCDRDSYCWPSRVWRQGWSTRSLVQRDGLFSHETRHQEVRPKGSSNGFSWSPVSYSDSDSDSGAGDKGSSNDCLIGIEHILTSAVALEVETCRQRCIRAVLREQARQAMNSSFGWDEIATASLAETRRTAFRARQLGKLHHYSTI